MQVVKIDEVADMLDCSVATVRRWLAEARRGERRFPLPLNRPYSQNVWRLEDIENWTENPVESQKRTGRQKMIQRRSEVVGLSRHGIQIE